MNRTVQTLPARTRASADPSPVEPPRDALVGTLARGFAVLDTMLAARVPLTLAEIAGLSHLDQSTTLRLLRALEEGGFIVRHALARRYSPSPKAIHPLALLHPVEQLRRETSPVLRELANELQQTVVFILFIGAERMVVEIAQTPGSLSPFYGTWLRGPLHGSGAGKSLLLGLTDDERRALLGPEPYAAWTPHTLSAWSDLRADLERSAERGYVVGRDEQRVGITAIGAPVGTWTGTHAGCLVMTGLTRDFDEARTSECGEKVRDAANLLLYQAPSLGAAAQFCGH
ncbi:IclR family transcriptional regulator [Caballeronia hypogeia]|uniref:IclR family transcriptional regulator n=1 Tax=Caballeronia hypogeia TaxID=1777140 RepID=A0A158ADZ4_9BURK|nr:IclR family transcriptional regulator C-terminal domain-containing protein [Caballeronia hypogeia]SAK56058.1 IclR family transcriptional regulator [Caballeronia hypogeia]